MQMKIIEQITKVETKLTPLEGASEIKQRPWFYYQQIS